MEDYKIIAWPNIQAYMEIEGFEENSTLITPNNSMGIDDATYLIDREWYDSINLQHN